MKGIKVMLAVALFVIAAAVMASEAEYDAVATLKNPDGAVVGKVTFRQTPHGVHVILDITNLPAGTHAFHIHGTGQCTPPDFKSAGGHFNPTGKQHGWYNPKGYHVGDLPNVTVGADGKARVEVMVPGLKIEDLFGAKGTAIVIHRGADDLKTDPAGAAGPRIACGVIERTL